jgi:hypothetical protein
MFATVNGLPCGVFGPFSGTDPNWLNYPNIPGLSFDATDFTSMQAFANYNPLDGSWQPTVNGSVSITNLTVTGWPKE